MAAVHGDDGDIFVYDGTQPVPDGVRRARILKDVKIIRARAFSGRQNLISVEFHDGVEIIEECAFFKCRSFKGPIKLLGVKIIKGWAFGHCKRITDVEFGDKLETVEKCAFYFCTALKKIKIPSVRTIGVEAFDDCDELSDVEFGEGLETLKVRAFSNCPKLKRVALPLKNNIIIEDGVFYGCPMLAAIDLVGGIHNTVASLHLESWRNEMNEEINGINQTLSTFGGVESFEPSQVNTGGLWRAYERNYGGYGQNPTFDVDWKERLKVVKWWMRAVLHQLNHYKDEHRKLLKEATTLLELALWKANLSDNNGGGGEGEGVRTLVEVESVRNDMRMTSGADDVIKNVLRFLVVKP